MNRSWEKQNDLNKIELLKLQKDVLSVYQNLDELTAKDPKDLPFDETERLKWAGILHQRPRDGHFLVHIKLPSGALSAIQADTIAELAQTFGDGNVQFTLRQACQIHNLTLDKIPYVLQRINEVGLTSMEADGDAVRNITGNPLMGVDPEETFDTTDLVNQLANFFNGKTDFSNLPRKFKISISGNPHDAVGARENDLGFVPAILNKNGEKLTGFHAYLGGGLSGNPQQLGQKTGYFLRPEDILPFSKAVVTIFRDHGFRNNRGHARFKYLLNEIGLDKMSSLIDEHAGPFLRGGRELSGKWCYGAFYGIHPQKQRGLYFAGIHIPCGIISAKDLKKIAALSRKYGQGRLRTTNAQNILMLDIPEESISMLKNEDIFSRYSLAPGMFSGYASACTGSDFCNFAAVETRHRLQKITEELDHEFSQINHPFRITLTGCGACCAGPQTADIGIRGGKGMKNGKIIDAFFLYVGGALGKDAHLGTFLQGKIPEDNLLSVLKEIIHFYLTEKIEDESFSDFTKRKGTQELQQIVLKYAMT